MESLSVALGSRSYPIHIGAGPARRAPSCTARTSAAAASAIVTNPTVAPLYLSKVKAGAAGRARDRDRRARRRAGQGLADAEQRFRRAAGRASAAATALIVALGGGVVGDLAGFAAAVYQRGVDFVQVPTTLLAQVDSSVGGKTAINHARGKNMIGAFHQPRAVIADVATLDTLPDRELRAGLAEVIKHGLALDAAFFDAGSSGTSRSCSRATARRLSYAVRRSCELKAAIVAADERESGARALLNFGHTFGHAIESGAGLRHLAARRGGRRRHGHGERAVAAAGQHSESRRGAGARPAAARRAAGRRAGARPRAHARADGGRQEGGEGAGALHRAGGDRPGRAARRSDESAVREAIVAALQ